MPPELDEILAPLTVADLDALDAPARPRRSEKPLKPVTVADLDALDRVPVPVRGESLEATFEDIARSAQLVPARPLPVPQAPQPPSVAVQRPPTDAELRAQPLAPGIVPPPQSVGALYNQPQTDELAGLRPGSPLVEPPPSPLTEQVLRAPPAPEAVQSIVRALAAAPPEPRPVVFERGGPPEQIPTPAYEAESSVTAGLTPAERELRGLGRAAVHGARTGVAGNAARLIMREAGVTPEPVESIDPASRTQALVSLLTSMGTDLGVFKAGAAIARAPMNAFLGRLYAAGVRVGVQNGLTEQAARLAAQKAIFENGVVRSVLGATSGAGALAFEDALLSVTGTLEAGREPSLAAAAKEAGKGAAVGAVAGVAGPALRVAARGTPVDVPTLDVLGSIFGFATAGPMIREGRMPTPGDLVDAGVAIGVLHMASALGGAARRAAQERVAATDIREIVPPEIYQATIRWVMQAKKMDPEAARAFVDGQILDAARKAQERVAAQPPEPPVVPPARPRPAAARPAPETAPPAPEARVAAPAAPAPPAEAPARPAVPPAAPRARPEAGIMPPVAVSPAPPPEPVTVADLEALDRPPATTPAGRQIGDEASLRPVVEAGGGEWVGVQMVKGQAIAVAFNDPESGSTIYLPPADLTEEQVRQAIAAKQAQFAAPAPAPPSAGAPPAREPGPRQGALVPVTPEESQRLVTSIDAFLEGDTLKALESDIADFQQSGVRLDIETIDENAAVRQEAERLRGLIDEHLDGQTDAVLRQHLEGQRAELEGVIGALTPAGAQPPRVVPPAARPAPTPAPAAPPAAAPTPEPIRHLYQGRGKSPAEVYGEANVQAGRGHPLFGPGEYYAFSREDASRYGEVTSEHAVTLRNPYRLTSDRQWFDLLRAADAEQLSSVGRTQGPTLEAAQRLQDYLRQQGYDGLIARFPSAREGDVSETGAKIKRIRESLGHSQVVKFAPAAPVSPPVVPTAPVTYQEGDRVRLTEAWGNLRAGSEGRIVQAGAALRVNWDKVGIVDVARRAVEKVEAPAAAARPEIRTGPGNAPTIPIPDRSALLDAPTGAVIEVRFQDGRVERWAKLPYQGVTAQRHGGVWKRETPYSTETGTNLIRGFRLAADAGEISGLAFTPLTPGKEAPTLPVEEAPREPEVPARRPGPGDQGALGGAPPEDVSGAGAGGPARPSPAPGLGANRPGVRGAGGEGPRAPAGVGGGPRGVGLPAERGGRAEPAEPGAEPAAREPVPGAPAGELTDPKTPTRGQPPVQAGQDYIITAEDRLGEGGPKQKFRDNVAAIALVKQIELEGRPATPEEQRVLVRYVGWGGLSQVFDTKHDMEYYRGRSDWAKEYQELRDLLTPDEYERARSSVLNAHFTSETVIRNIWAALEHMGYRGGKMLETSAGIGHFLGLQPLATVTSRTAVELDSLTGRILQLLYPKAHVRIQGFETIHLPDNFFTTVVGNVPFGDYGVTDRTPNAQRYAERGLDRRIHDYFLAKGLDKLQPGGLMAVVTSSGTLDKVNKATRTYLAERGELLGAIRLPNTAFKGNAATEVTTDILFLRKRQEPIPRDEAAREPWIETVTRRDLVGGREYDDYGKPIRPELNRYYHEHPEMVLGKLDQDKLHPDRLGVSDDGRDLATALREAILKLPENAMQPVEHPATDPENARTQEEMVPPAGVTKRGGYTVGADGKVYRNMGAVDATGRPVLTVTDITGKPVARIKGMLQIRDAAREVIRGQLQGIDDAGLKAAQKHLGRLYDAYVKRMGFIREQGNALAMRGDPDYNLLAALEVWDARTKKATKAPIFTKRTIQYRQKAERADTAQQALLISLNETGRIDWDRMEQLTGKGATDLQPELRGRIYRNPEGTWETDDEYLSGDVRAKLKAAESAAAVDPVYEENVAALREVQPDDLAPGQIDARLSAPWIPKEDVQAFIAETLGVAASRVKVSYLPATGDWDARVDDRKYADTVQAESTFGTRDANAVYLIDLALNLQRPVIYREERDTRVRDPEATLAAEDAQQKVKDEFRRWVWSDEARAERLARIYNDTFNATRQRQFDGSHLTLPGISPEWAELLRPHQKNAIWRGLQGSNVLLAHVVGSGKTAVMIGTAMEARRLGLSTKPMLVVPNHMPEQIARDFLAMYPAANILVAKKGDLGKDRRQQFMSQIATGDWDAVIVPHTSFSLLPVTEETWNKHFKEQLDALRDAMNAARAEGDRMTVKRIESRINKLEEKLQKRKERQAKQKDRTIYFEELGADLLFVDEAHYFKNLFVPTKMTRVKGIGASESLRAFDLFAKTQWLTEINGGRGVVFSTGTPISNSVAELFTMMRYLMYPALRQRGLANFDQWASTFGETQSTPEMTPEGRFRVQTRFSKFSNVPELASLFQQVADVQQDREALGIKVPALRGGKPVVHVSPMSAEQLAYSQTLIGRVELIRKGPKAVDPRDDNMLKVTSDGRKNSLDVRLVTPEAPENPKSKVNLLVDAVRDIWRRTIKDRAVQMVFLDLATPKGQRSKRARYIKVAETPAWTLTAQEVADRVNKTRDNVLAHDGHRLEVIKALEAGEAVRREVLADYPTLDAGVGLSAEAQAHVNQLMGRVAEEEPEVTATGDAPTIETEAEWRAREGIYGEIKRKLIAKGVPAEEIAFIHDAKTPLAKQRFFDDLNEGRIRVVLASTDKMGVGTNIQRRAYAIHHVDAPWRPVDIEQRNGRIVRQGNQFDEVEEHHYISEGAGGTVAFDGFLWQLIRTKAQFIKQIMQGKATVREIEDVSDLGVTANQFMAMATGDPRIIEKVNVDNELGILDVLRAAQESKLWAMKGQLARLPATLQDAQEHVANIGKDIETRDQNKGDFAMTVGKTAYTERGPAGEALLKAVQDLPEHMEKYQVIGQYRGFDLEVRRIRLGAADDKDKIVHVWGHLRGAASHDTKPSLESLDANLRGFETDLLNARTKVRETEERIARLHEEVSKPFDKQARYDELVAKKKVIDEALGITKAEKEGPPPPEEGEGEPPAEPGEGRVEGMVPREEALFEEAGGGVVPPRKPPQRLAPPAGEPPFDDITRMAGGYEIRAHEPDLPTGRRSYSVHRGDQEIGERTYSIDQARAQVARYRRETRQPPVRGRVEGQQPAPAASPTPQTTDPTAPGFQIPRTATERQDLLDKRQIIRQLDAAFGVPIRVGRFHKPGARGIYKVDPEVIRLRRASMLGTAAHELGHHLQKKRLIDATGYEDQLRALGGPLTGDPLKEGISEFIRLYVEDPAAAVAATGQPFVDRFEQQLHGAWPEALAALLHGREQYATFKAASAEDRIVATIDQSPRTRGWHLLRDMTEGDFWHKLYTVVFDDLHPIKQLEQALAEGRTLSADESAYVMARLTRGSGGVVEVFLEQGPVDWNTLRPVPGIPAFRDIIRPIWPHRTQFEGYLVARRAQEFLDSTEERLRTAGQQLLGMWELDRAGLDAALDRMDQARPEFLEAAQGLQRWNDALLDYVAASGRYGAETIERIKELHRNYAPLYRVFEELPDDIARPAATTKLADLPSPVKTIRGSERRIVSPLEGFMRNAQAMISVANANEVGNLMVDLVDRAEAYGKLIMGVPPRMAATKFELEEIRTALEAAGLEVEEADLQTVATVFRPVNRREPNIITLYRDGKAQRYLIDPWLYRAMTGLDRGTAHVVLRFAAVPAAVFRAGVILSPVFQIRNFLRDQMTVAIQSRAGVPFLGYAKALIDQVGGGSDITERWKAAGGAIFSNMALDRVSLERTLQDTMEGKPTKLMRMINPLHPWEAYKQWIKMAYWFTELSEAPTRIGVFKRALERPLPEDVTPRARGLRAAYESREASLDFRRGGLIRAMGLTQTVAFLGPNIQGWDKFVRTWRDNPRRALVAAAIMIAIEYLLHEWNKTQPAYDNVPAWRRDIFYNVAVPENVPGIGGSVLSVPGPFEWKLFYSALPRRLFEWLDDTAPELMADLWETLERGLGMNPIPTIVRPMLETAMNWDLFRGRPIEPRGMEDIGAEERVGRRTSEVAKRVGALLEYSPLKIDHLIRGYTGTVGADLTQALDGFLREEDWGESPTPTLADRPVLRGFIGRVPNLDADVIERFYHYHQRATEAKRTHDRIVRQHRDPSEWDRRHAWELALYPTLDRQARRFSEARRRLIDIERDPSLSGEAKREQLDQIAERMVEAAQQRVRGAHELRRELRATPQREEAAAR